MADQDKSQDKSQEKSQPTHMRLHDADPKRLMEWWSSLEDNRGDRARLSRADAPEDLLLTAAFHRFLCSVPERWASQDHLYLSAMVAALLSHIRMAVPKESFATSLAQGDKPVMSELRFQQLLKSRTPDELFRRLIRAIRLLDRKANPLSLTQGVLRWYDEYLYGPDTNPARRLSVEWASDYFTNLKHS